MSFSNKTLEEDEWVRLHYEFLKEEFDRSGRFSENDRVSGFCEYCNGKGKIRNEFDNLEECEECCGGGEVVLTEQDLFREFCTDMYLDQRLTDMTKFLNYERLMNDLTIGV